jgi:hypothetical protein
LLLIIVAIFSLVTCDDQTDRNNRPPVNLVRNELF